jgi:hypothetical protein
MATHTGGDDILVQKKYDDHDNKVVDNNTDNTDATRNVTVAPSSRHLHKRNEVHPHSGNQTNSAKTQ